MFKNIEKILSLAFHPVFVAVYTTLFYLNLFSDAINEAQRSFTFYAVFFGSLVFPIAGSSLLLVFNKIDSIHLKTKRERIVPIFISGVSISLAAKFIMDLPNNASNAISLYLIGVVISLALILLLLSILKISIHSAAIAAAIGFFIYISLHYHVNLNTTIAFSFVLLGAVATARLRLRSHSKAEIYLGAVIGFLPQFMFLFLN